MEQGPWHLEIFQSGNVSFGSEADLVIRRFSPEIETLLGPAMSVHPIAVLASSGFAHRPMHHQEMSRLFRSAIPSPRTSDSVGDRSPQPRLPHDGLQSRRSRSLKRSLYFRPCPTVLLVTARSTHIPCCLVQMSAMGRKRKSGRDLRLPCLRQHGSQGPFDLPTRFVASRT